MDWQNPKNKQFVEDMESAGYIVHEYSGRGMFGRVCPSVSCKRSEQQAVIRATTCKVVFDNLGMDLVAYTGLGEKQEPMTMDVIEHDDDDMGEWLDARQAARAKREASRTHKPHRIGPDFVNHRGE